MCQTRAFSDVSSPLSSLIPSFSDFTCGGPVAGTLVLSEVGPCTLKLRSHQSQLVLANISRPLAINGVVERNFHRPSRPCSRLRPRNWNLQAVLVRETRLFIAAATNRSWRSRRDGTLKRAALEFGHRVRRGRSCVDRDQDARDLHIRRSSHQRIRNASRLVSGPQKNGCSGEVMFTCNGSGDYITGGLNS